jgi:hypothetical protein
VGLGFGWGWWVDEWGIGSDGGQTRSGTVFPPSFPSSYSYEKLLPSRAKDVKRWKESNETFKKQYIFFLIFNI